MAALSACRGAWHKPSWESVDAVHPAHHEPQNSRDTDSRGHAEGIKSIQGIHFWGCTSINVTRLLQAMGTCPELRPSHQPSSVPGCSTP